ncbi:MAG: hypothetical protein HQL07_01805 [Nitrospirae bacterium]|nr:hypothetical protein [Magnetococcales bacterium]
MIISRQGAGFGEHPFADHATIGQPCQNRRFLHGVPWQVTDMDSAIMDEKRG